MTIEQAGGRVLGGGWRSWMMLVLLMALCFTSHFNRASITSAGDERIMKQFQISPEQMGMVYSSFLLVYTLFMVPGGWLIDRKGPRIALALMGFGSAIFCGVTGGVGLGLVPEALIWPALILVRGTMGLLTTPLHPGAARMAGNWFEGSRVNLVNGLITGASILAYAVVHAIFGALIDRVDWPRAFLVTAAATATLTLIWLVLAHDFPEGSGQVRNVPTAVAVSAATPHWPVRSIIGITLSYAAVGYFQYLFFYWMHFYFENVLQMGKEASRLYAGLPNLAMAACMPLGGILADRRHRSRGLASIGFIPKWSMSVSALLLLLGLVVKGNLWVVACFTLSLGVLGLCEATFWTVAVGLGGNRGATTAAIMNTGGNGIGLLAPMLTPVIASRMGWEWGIGLGAAVGIVGAVCWIWIRPARNAGDPVPMTSRAGV